MEIKKKDSLKIKFLGAAGTVTGSKTLLEVNGQKILIDCGLFQGIKELRRMNWDELPINPSEIQAVILTHAHLDHSGYLPKLINGGFKGKIYCTRPTKEIAQIILNDSAKIQEEDAERANRYAYTKHAEAIPLYTQKEALNVANHFSTHDYNEWVIINSDTKFKLLDAGHILGSSIVEIKANNKTIVFSGDLGRTDPMLLYPPKKIKQTDYLILESTYGDREHSYNDALVELERIVNSTIGRGGILMIPSFAVERTQELIFMLYKLRSEEKISNVPVYLDSPMGLNTTYVFEKYPKWQDVSKKDLSQMYKHVTFIKSAEQSKAVVHDKKPKIIIAGSGMIQGGRIIHYLNNHMDNENNTLLFVGFQAAGTRGRTILEGSGSVKFFGEYHEIKCQIESISSMSGHADRSELVEWVKNFEKAPKRIFLNHGEPHQSDALRTYMKTKIGWKATIPKLGETFGLT